MKEQLDSIMRQKNVKLHLFVRDDGSSDETGRILTEYSAAHDNMSIEFGENLGVGNSFMSALYAVPNEYDFYAFSDQDDIWEDNKLTEAIDMLLAHGAMLYGSNQECVDKNGCTVKMRYSETDNINLSPIAILQNNMIAGCTMVFNSKLYDILTTEANRPSSRLLKNRMHDVWVALVAAVHNGLVYDNRSFIKYRQHENNVVGAQSNAKKRRKERNKKLLNKELRNGRSLTAKEICERFGQEVKNDYLLEICANAQKFKNKCIIINNHKLLRSYSGESKMSFIIKVLSGLF